MDVCTMSRTESAAGGAGFGAPRSIPIASSCCYCGAAMPRSRRRGRPRLVCCSPNCERRLAAEHQSARRRRRRSLLMGKRYGAHVCGRCFYLAHRCRCDGAPRAAGA